MTVFIKTKYGISILGIITGMMLLTGFTTVVEVTNEQSFCISCHIMRSTVYEEYQETPHGVNRAGVHATCADCHVPKETLPKLLRKVSAVNDLYHTIIGTVDTPEKFEAKRLQLAERVWEYMKESDSRECRSCHNFSSLDLEEQLGRANRKHNVAIEKGQTCIDCHKGIAHELPDAWLE